MPNIETSEENEAQGGERVQREWLTPTEAMRYLGVSRATLYHLMDTGALKFYVLRGVQKRRIRKEDLDALFEEGKPSEPPEVTKSGKALGRSRSKRKKGS